MSYAALNPDEAERRAREVAAHATCQAVDTAIAAYVSIHDEAPAGVAELADYVKGDITAYRIVGGMAAGPGC